MELTFKYYACDDANTFCVPVTQNYNLTLERDPLAGSAMRGRGGGGGFEGGFGGAGRGRGRRAGAGGMAARLQRFDQNGDGQLSKDELPAQMQSRFADLDTNGDGVLDKKELEAMASRVSRRRRP